MARKICDFSHISPELSREQVDELIGYYKTTHQKWFLYKKAYNNYKLIKYAARLTSGVIAGGGIASVIISGSVLTIISLSASLLIEIILGYKNVNENMNNCKYAYVSYQHLMIQIIFLYMVLAWADTEQADLDRLTAGCEQLLQMLQC